jgi:hypothetical protein
MEHRDTPRMVPAEGRPRDARVEPEAEGPRFARFVVLPAERRFVLNRLGLAALASGLALVVVGVVGSSVVEKAVRWLHAQPQYRTTFGAITLVPPPPAWYRGGAAVFLDRVRRGAQREDLPFSALDADLAELGREFRLYCWVKRVGQIRLRSPNRLVVPLEYREPVAMVDVTGAQDWTPIDGDAVILPLEDVGEASVASLIPIFGLGVPYDPRPGQVWKRLDVARGVGETDVRAFSAARLAAYLKSKSSRSPLRPVAIHTTGTSNLYLEIDQKTMVYWAEAPGDEAPGRLKADQKLAMLQRWLLRRPATPIVIPYFLNFSKEGVVVRKDERRN